VAVAVAPGPLVGAPYSVAQICLEPAPQPFMMLRSLTVVWSMSDQAFQGA